MNNVEAAVRAKTLRGGGYSNVGAVHTPKPETKERERAASCEQRRLVLELSCDKETILAKLMPDLGLV